jgi:hypothetical protein
MLSLTSDLTLTSITYRLNFFIPVHLFILLFLIVLIFCEKTL